MAEAAADSWAVGAAYEFYMGRWSRPLARAFLQWLRPRPAGHWLEVGCGIGSLTDAIRERCQPASIVASDPSAAFIEHARNHSTDPRTTYVVAAADSLPTRSQGFDAIVSGLVLNFVPEPGQALAAMRERLGADGVIGAYVWDYAGVEFLTHFWEEAVLVDPNAAALDESRRFAFWQPRALASLFEQAGLSEVQAEHLDMPTQFADFDDYWRPFLGGTGPAPSYVSSLEPAQRELLRERLRRRIPVQADGRIQLRARASVARGVSA